MKIEAIALLGLFPAACATGPLPDAGQLSADIVRAETAVSDLCLSKARVVDQITCLDIAGRSVWQMEAPSALDIYTRFATVRYAISLRIDAGIASEIDSIPELKAAEGELWRQFIERKSAEDTQRAINAAKAQILGLGLLNAGATIGVSMADSPTFRAATTTCFPIGNALQCSTY